MYSIKGGSLGRKTSPLWKIFEKYGPTSAKCTICGSVLSYQSSTGNLKRHLVFKHRGVFKTIAHQGEPKVTYLFKDLIKLVEKHPCIWNISSEDYGDYWKQKHAWRQIALDLYPKGNRYTLAARLSKEFNQLKSDYFTNRERSAYYEELSFLEQSNEQGEETIQSVEIEREENGTDNSAANEDSLSDTNEEDGAFSLNQEYNNHTIKMSIKDGKNLKLPKMDPISFNLKVDNADEDRLFLLSLADEVRKVPVEFEMSFRTELLREFNKLVEKYTSD